LFFFFSDIKRVYNFRDAFALFDFDDDDSMHVRTLLARAFIHPQYVNYGSGSDTSTDSPASFGNRFLSFALCLHAPLVDVLLAAMREQLPNGMSLSQCISCFEFKL
jgi:condensin-2 complex subunit G2